VNDEKLLQMFVERQMVESDVVCSNVSSRNINR